MPDTINPFATGDGPRYLSIFQKGRLNPNIPEHKAIITQFLRAFEGTDQYDEYIDRYEQVWGVQLDERKKKQEDEPKSVTLPGGGKPIEMAMEETSDPATRVVVVAEEEKVKTTIKVEKPKKAVEAKKEEAKEPVAKPKKKKGRPKKKS